MGIAVGIDLGTTFSRIAVMECGRPRIIPSAEGDSLFPSVVAISNTGEYLVGQIAKRQAVTNPENTVYGVKRFMGCNWGEPLGCGALVEEDARRKTYKVTRGQNNEVRLLIGDIEYSPPEVSAIVLQQLKAYAEDCLGERVTDAVITVPGCFNIAQRQATKEAAVMAGLNVLRIVDEPSAAAIAYGFSEKCEGRVAVYDFGGGVFNISIIEIESNEYTRGVGAIVKSVAGDSRLGGEDFDQRIVDWICDEYEKYESIDLRQDSVAMLRLKEAAERAKIELSTVQQTTVDLPFVLADASGSKDLSITLTRARLEQLAVDLVERSLETCKQALRGAGMTTTEIDKVILVGGQTRMPLIQQKVKQFFGREPTKGINPDEAVVIGAAIQAGVLRGEVKDVLLLEVTSLTFGIETQAGVATPLIPRNTIIPTAKSRIFSTANDYQTSLQIHVLEGERPMANDNASLGSLVFEGIRPAPRGEPQIEITLDIDARRMLSVKVVDKATGKEAEFHPQHDASIGARSTDPCLVPTEPSTGDYQGESIVVDSGIHDIGSGSRPLRPRSMSVHDMLDRQADRDLKKAETDWWKERAKNEKNKRDGWWV